MVPSDQTSTHFRVIDYDYTASVSMDVFASPDPRVDSWLGGYKGRGWLLVTRGAPPRPRP